MKSIKCVLAAAVFSVLAGELHAASGSTYQSSLAGSSYQASASWQGGTTPLVGGDLAQSQQMSALLNTSQAYYLGIQSALNDATRAAAAQASGNGISVQMKYPSGILNGTLNASLAGLQNGNLHFVLGGLNYDTVLQVNGSSGPVSYECNVSLNVGSISLALDYNPYNGVVSGASANFVPSQSVNCDNSLSWLPWVGDYINSRLQSAISSMVMATSALSGQVLAVDPQSALFGFVGAIQPNTYMYGGVDVGMYLKNNIQSLYINKQVLLTVAQPASFYVPTYNHLPRPASRSGTAVSIDFLDGGVKQVGFKVDLVRNFNWTLISGED